MKPFFIVLTALFSAQVLAAEWSAPRDQHPLWDVFNVPVKSFPRERQEKRIGRIYCSRELTQTHCNFPDRLSNKEVSDFYKVLDVKPVGTSGAYTEIKLIDRLIVVAETDSNQENNNSRLYVDHACRKVGTKREAEACMSFWAAEILPSFEEANDTAVVTLNEGILQKAERSLQYAGYNAKHLKKMRERLSEAAFIGLMQEHQDETHLYHYAIRKGENSLPQEILDFNEADVEYSGLGEEAKKVKKGEADDFIAQAIDTLFLGLSRDTFPDFAEEVESHLRYIIDESRLSGRRSPPILRCRNGPLTGGPFCNVGK